MSSIAIGGEGQMAVDVYLEVGNKRTFACAVEWPGWSRSGRDDDGALEALAAAGPRYLAALGEAAGGPTLPRRTGGFRVIERLAGNATTDFGAPGAVPDADRRPLEPAASARQAELLWSCWRAFDRAVAAARGRELTKGPRGGGRELEGITAHLREAEKAYLSKLGGRYGAADAKPDPDEDLAAVRDASIGLLGALAHGEPPPRTPRSGSLWPPRYFVRRSAWHALDHAWEIQDRSGTEA
jgi:hypothetical protein